MHLPSQHLQALKFLLSQWLLNKRLSLLLFYICSSLCATQAQRLAAAPFQTQILSEATALLQTFSSFDSNAFIQRVHPRFLKLAGDANWLGKEFARMAKANMQIEFTLTSPSYLVVKGRQYICTFSAIEKVVVRGSSEWAEQVWLAAYSDDRGKTWRILPLFTQYEPMKKFVQELHELGLGGDTPHTMDSE